MSVSNSQSAGVVIRAPRKPLLSFVPTRIIRLDLAFIFDPLGPLRDFAGTHGDPAEEADGQEKRLQEYLQHSPIENTVLLLMSSGNYGGLNLESLVARLPGEA